MFRLSIRPALLALTGLTLCAADPATAQRQGQQSREAAQYRKAMDAVFAVLDEARAAFGKGELGPALDKFLWVEEQLTAIYSPRHTIWAAFYLNRAEVLLAGGRTADASRLANMAIAQIKNRQAGETPSVPADNDAIQFCRAQAVLAGAAFAQRRFDEAIAIGKAAPGSSGPYERNCAADGVSIAYFALRAQGRGAEAQRLVQPLQPYTPPGQGRTLEEILKAIDTALDANDFDTARLHYWAALKAVEQPNFATVRRTVRDTILAQAAEVIRRSGRATEAEMLADEGLGGPGAISVSLRPPLLMRRGFARYDLGRFDEAERDLRQALADCRQCSNLDLMLATGTLRMILILKGAFPEAARLQIPKEGPDRERAPRR